VMGFALLFALATNLPYLAIDPAITHTVQRFEAPWFRALMRWVSWPGFGPQSVVIVALAGAALLAAGLRWEAACAVGAGLAPAVLSTAVKVIIQRPRPAASLVQVTEVLNSYSFPSGHVFFYTVFFGFLLYLVYVLFRPSRWRALALALLSLLVGLVGVSRIELGQHWFSDVLAAYLIGSVWLALTIWVYRWVKIRYMAPR
jgi:membrane-associated phospholipid phosphatase